MLTRDQEV